MSFQADRTSVPVLEESGKLAGPVYDAAAHSHPTRFPIRIAHDILAVHISDSVLGKQRVAVRVRRLTGRRGIPGVPVQLEVRRANRSKSARSLLARCGVASVLVFKQERCPPASSYCRGLTELFIDRFPVRLLIFQAPEVEDTDPIDVEHFGQLERAFKQFALLFIGKSRAELIPLRAEF